MNPSIIKEKLRNTLPVKNITSEQFGKLAQCVRRLDGYKSCRQIFVSPVASLWQVRINALLDQKELIMPCGGLKQGFVRFKPNSISFSQLGHAVSFMGMEKFGERLTTAALKKLKIDLFLMDSEAVDKWGGRLGDGLGVTDLAMAILGECNAINNEARIFSIIAENRLVLERLPREPWDITLDGMISLSTIEYYKREGTLAPNIHWSTLPRKRVRKIQPLWDIYCAANPEKPTTTAKRKNQNGHFCS